jgi:hypothetical protein
MQTAIDSGLAEQMAWDFPQMNPRPHLNRQPGASGLPGPRGSMSWMW